MTKNIKHLIYSVFRNTFIARYYWGLQLSWGRNWVHRNNYLEVPPLAGEERSKEDVLAVYADFDKDSLHVVLRYYTLMRMRKYSVEMINAIINDHLPYIRRKKPENKEFPYHDCLKHIYFTDSEIAEGERIRKQYETDFSHVKLSTDFYDPSSMFFHHGLAFLPQRVLSELQNTVFFDAGAYIGDSAVFFQKVYHPQKVYSFEAFPQNAKLYLETMALNQIPETKYELIECGISSSKGICKINASFSGSGNSVQYDTGNFEINLISIDDFCEERSLTGVKLIKSDIEGMEMELLKGAKKTITKYRPVLLISIYHSFDDFFEIYPYCKNMVENYHWEIRWLSPGISPAELYLIGYPREMV